MSNIYDHAYDLERALRESQAYKDLQHSFEEVWKDPDAKKIFEDYRNLQLDLQKKQHQGTELTKEEIEQAQKQYDIVQRHPKIGKLLENENRLSVIIEDITKIISQPLEDLYQRD